ncbi:carbohydrate-binding module family 50 protein [Trichoderma asperellum CBS 433.97]|uniref:Carbohydrate-binding module family 50 protein n=1 Tax=Trichoderma asperellum (strain ATCC 204424 / CBS 433.97 / NBRC 101777) TaxID=1042311 RepID=A0A2T3ZLK6_TRIA4|nr:carbohydrate-binding module family 50 protein [Trichoderma asperellum CBS 433.97]PTB45697.1 carbohydrate-binding module family 50 protein [Trichoderma asperellum CBS 433.97]
MRCSMPLSLYGFLWSLLLQSLVHSQILSNLIQVEAPGNFSASCSATFNQSIACSLALSRVASGTFIPTSNDLPRICTDACLSELKSLRVQQFSVCNSSDVAVIKGLAYPATYNTDLLLFTYNYACMKDLTSNEYCFPDVWEWNSDTTVMTSTELCSDCNLLIQQAQLESPFGYDDDAASDYSSLTSSTTKLASTRVTTTTPAAPSCKSTDTIKKNDTCRSISESQKVATFYLMQANNLPGYCSQFPPAGSDLCIPQSCDLYTVAENDSCYGIAQAHNGTFSATQLISWNPNINRQCSNLNQIAGYQIYVSFPGPPSLVATGSESITTPAAAIPTNLSLNTTTHYGDSCASISMATGISIKDFYFLNPMVNSTCGNLWLDTYYCVEAVGNIATYSDYNQTAHPFTWPAVGQARTKTSAPSPQVTLMGDLPLAPGTLDCGSYTQYYNSSRLNGNQCGMVAWVFTLNVTDFVAWNPSLSYNATDPSACVLLPGYRYCIGGPLPASKGTSSTPHTKISRFTTQTISVPSTSPTITYSPNGSCGGKQSE